VSVFAVLVENNPLSKEYLEGFKSRISDSKDFFKNPFNGQAKITELNMEDLLILVDMSPKYPPFFVVGLAPLVLGFILRGGLVWSWMSSVGLAFLSLGFFWSPAFFVFMMFLGLRKKGYRGSFKWLRGKQALQRVIRNAV